MEKPAIEISRHSVRMKKAPEESLRDLVLAIGRAAQAQGLSEEDIEEDIDRHVRRWKRRRK